MKASRLLTRMMSDTVESDAKSGGGAFSLPSDPFSLLAFSLVLAVGGAALGAAGDDAGAA